MFIIKNKCSIRFIKPFKYILNHFSKFIIIRDILLKPYNYLSVNLITARKKKKMLKNDNQTADTFKDSSAEDMNCNTGTGGKNVLQSYLRVMVSASDKKKVYFNFYN